MTMIDRPFSQPRLQSSQSHFSKVPQADVPRSVFDRSHQFKTTLNSGLLVPVLCDEVVPGDTFKLSMTTFARLATPKTPFMDNLFADVFFWFVPNRLIWDNWEKFNGAQDNPGDSTDFLIPQVTTPVGGYAIGSLFDYFGVPTGVAGLGNINALHSRAYNLIYNEWYRDQNLQNSITVDKGNGPDTDTNYVLRRRGKRHDYFTSALPWTQKGPAVQLPLGSSAPVIGIGKYNNNFTNAGYTARESDGNIRTYAFSSTIDNSIDNSEFYVERNPNNVNFPNIRADLSAATASTINALRQAFQLQRMFERDARGGTRYVEILKSHFGVTSPDFRLQRPEYLGGGSTMINTSPVPQTSASESGSPQGNLTAMGTFSHSGVGFNHSFVEHGVVLGLISIRADLTYQQGLNRMWSRRTRFDFYWPALSHLGEQTVLNKEIYAQGAAGSGADDQPFGYQERYAEYRYKPSLITGKFRSSDPQSLDFWHLAQDFGNLPVLGSSFIQENPPIERVVAVTDEPQFLLDVVFNFHCARPMPVYSVPGLIDHF